MALQRAQFLNVDLDIESRSRSGLARLITAMGSSVVILNHEGRRATLELAKQPPSANHAIRSFVKLVQRLSVNERSEWNQCRRRVLSIGLQAGSSPHQLVSPITADTLQQLVSISGALEITLYAPPK